MAKGAKPWESRRAGCLECRHERYMHEYEDTSGKYVLGPCKSEPRGEPKLAHLCGCICTRFEAPSPAGVGTAAERVGR